MHTRAAAKKLADIAATAGSAVDALTGQAEVMQAPTITDGPGPMGSLPSATTTITGGVKRKRGGKKQAQPLKGGWVLPHGMGAGVAALETSGPQDDEIALPALSPADAPVNAEDPTQIEIAPSAQSSTKTTVVKQTTRTRLSLRTAKTSVDDRRNDQNDQNQQETSIKLEESESPAIGQENGHQR